MLRPVAKALLLLLVLLAPVGIAACGGDDEEAAAPEPVEQPVTPDLTMDELVSAGDGICAEVNAAIGTIQTIETTDETVQSDQIADLYAGVAERLEGLGTPSDGEAPTAVIAAATELGDPAIADPEATLAEFQTAASAYGFSDCAEDPAAPVSTGTDTDTGAGTGTDDATDGGTDGATVDPAPAPAPAPAEPPTGGGVAPSQPDSGGGSGGSSGGISPG